VDDGLGWSSGVYTKDEKKGPAFRIEWSGAVTVRAGQRLGSPAPPASWLVRGFGGQRTGRVESGSPADSAAIACFVILSAPSMILRKARVAPSSPHAGTSSAVSRVV
jgi:hypothetical protein